MVVRRPLNQSEFVTQALIVLIRPACAFEQCLYTGHHFIIFDSEILQVVAESYRKRFGRELEKMFMKILAIAAENGLAHTIPILW